MHTLVRHRAVVATHRAGGGVAWRPWLGAWLGLAGLGVVNGVVRQAVYADRLGDLTAHQVSTGVYLVASGALVWAWHRGHPLDDTRAGLQVGAAWTVMTLAFEFGAGHWVFGNSWEHLLADYDLTAGRVWVLVPLWLLVAPAAVHRLQRRRSG